MRFLEHEHTAVVSALEAKGVDLKTVLFVKRRGRLHVQVPGRADTFAFFRRKSTTIDEAHEWEHRTDYFIGSGKEHPCAWPQVLQAFTAWLNDPSPSGG